MRIATIALVVISLLTCATRAADWPQFQGPLRTGSSPETGLLRQWPKDGPPVVWRVPIKHGWSTPAVVGDDIYLCATETARGDNEIVTCLSAATGQTKWTFSYEVGPYWQRNIGWARGGFRATPAVDGDRLFTLGAVGHLYCLDRHTGKVIWSQNLWDTWNPSGEKGYDFTPIVEDGKLILWYSDGASRVESLDRKEVLCRALDPATGKELWQFSEPHREPARMGEGQTPAIATFAGDKCALVTANCELKALRLSDGKQVWHYECVRRDGRGTTIPTPLVLDKLIVHIPDNDVAHIVEVDRDKLSIEPRIVWKKDINTYGQIHQFRHVRGYLYGFTGEIHGFSEQTASDSMMHLTCVDLATGDVKWSEPGFKCGVAITEADGLLFVRSYQTLRLIEATPDGYRLKGEVHTHDVWKPTLNLLDFVQPVLSNGKLYVRTPETLLCYNVIDGAAK